jgi:hypothetical protein
VDTDGRRCGLDNGVRDKPYLFFFDLAKCAQIDAIINGCHTPQVRFIANERLHQSLPEWNAPLPVGCLGSSEILNYDTLKFL